jgi:exosortase A-associated hydrolase 2
MPDLYGTGDSEGDFADADLTTWRSDLGRVASWSAADGTPIVAMLGIRLGCALGASVVESGAIGPLRAAAFWQPVFDGARFLQQFLRMRLAASLAQDRKETIADLRQHLARDEVLEVGGYGLSGELARNLDSLVVPQRLAGALGRLAWIEVVRDVAASPPVMATKLLESTVAAGGHVAMQAHAGEPFWATTEIISNRQIVDASVEHLEGAARGGELK